MSSSSNHHSSGDAPQSNVHQSPESEGSLPLSRMQDISDESQEWPWGQKTVASFDGGGIRGYSSLLILKRLMLEIKIIETQSSRHIGSSGDYPWMGSVTRNDGAQDPDDINSFLPCHYFDYMVGTSTGGLIAIMLGRLRMTVDEALDEYVKFGNEVFGKARWYHERSILWWPRAKYSSKKTSAAFQAIIRSKLEKESRDENIPQTIAYRAQTEQFKYRKERTRTMVFSFCIDKEESIDWPYVWRSYPCENPVVRNNHHWRPHNPGRAHVEPIWQVARATSAAPRYFESIRIGGMKFLDGAMCANNPAKYAVQEINHLHGYAPTVFLSIGTGKKRNNGAVNHNHQVAHPFNNVDQGSRKQWLRKYLEIGHHWKNFMMDSEGDNGVNGWNGLCQQLGVQHWRRFNVEGDLALIPLDDWQPLRSGETTIDRIKRETETYLSSRETRNDIEQMAAQLVAIRQSRARTERWESFAVDVAYRCPEHGCQGRDIPTVRTRRDLRQHFLSFHPNTVSEVDLTDRLNSGRIRPT